MSEDLVNIPLDPSEHTTPVMMYTRNALCWGHMVTVKTISAGRVLLGMTVPDYLTLYHAQLILTTGPKFSDRYKFFTLNVPTHDILGFHLMPPLQEPPDYEEGEPNRKMTPVTALVGSFSFNGVYRISTQSTFSRTVAVSKSTFFSFYEVEIKQTQNPQAKAMHTDFALVRRDGTFFAEQEE